MALSGCRVDATVDIQVARDGSGTVILTLVADAEAVGRIPDAPDGLYFDDLVDVGWTVEGPQLDQSGVLTVTVSKSFGESAGLPERCRALVGSTDKGGKVVEAAMELIP